MRSRAAALLWIVAGACSAGPPTQLYYRDHTVGSQWAYNPLATATQYVLDGAQVESFETHDFGRDLGSVLDHLGSPFHQIEDEGWKSFVNTEVFPIDSDHLDDSLAILPNVALHMLGGGLVFRKDAEWLKAHDVPAPYLLAATLAMTAEILGEAIEKPAADDTDEVADVWIWRPLGLLLYGNEDSARWMKDNLDPVDWPSQLVWDVRDEQFRNIGMNYVFRPPLLGDGSTQFFAYTGMTNLFGLSHALGNGELFSWGAGRRSSRSNQSSCARRAECSGNATRACSRRWSCTAPRATRCAPISTPACLLAPTRGLVAPDSSSGSPTMATWSRACSGACRSASAGDCPYRTSPASAARPASLLSRPMRCTVLCAAVLALAAPTPCQAATRMVCTVPVKLKPDWSYELWLNRGKFDSFRGEDGAKLRPVHVTFATRAK